jgi:hypothetical protein
MCGQCTKSVSALPALRRVRHSSSPMSFSGKTTLDWSATSCYLRCGQILTKRYPSGKPNWQRDIVAHEVNLNPTLASPVLACYTKRAYDCLVSYLEMAMIIVIQMWHAPLTNLLARPARPMDATLRPTIATAHGLRPVPARRDLLNYDEQSVEQRTARCRGMRHGSLRPRQCVKNGTFRGQVPRNVC